MYYGYDENKQIIMADMEFIELLGYKEFKDIIENKIASNIKFENQQIYIEQKDKNIKANYVKTLFYTNSNDITLVKLSNIIETKNKVSKLQLNYEPIYLDVEKISKEIGLSVDDYKLYLDSFIDQSIIDEKKLLEGDDRAIKNLANLALTLKIPNINILLLKIQKLPKAERTYYIDEYYTKLALLTLKTPNKSKEETKSINNIFIEDTKDAKEEVLDSRFTELIDSISEKNESDKEFNFEIKEKSEIETPTESKKVESKNEKEEELMDLDLIDLDMDLNLDDELDSLDEKDKKETLKTTTQTPPHIPTSSDDSEKIILENAKPLPINYNPKIAADELNLPVVLIEEFVEDFIEQAHHDKDHLLASYYQKDMDNIHELGHKLKGAASNLRINELADVLEQIQFCTEHSKLKDLFMKFWGLFISLENYMKKAKKV
jgi:HPt (histidine-containing phosphotransfer) domain-containing protein